MAEWLHWLRGLGFTDKEARRIISTRLAFEAGYFKS